MTLLQKLKWNLMVLSIKKKLMQRSKMPLHQLMLLRRHKQKQEVPRAVILLLFLILGMVEKILVQPEDQYMKKRLTLRWPVIAKQNWKSITV